MDFIEISDSLVDYIELFYYEKTRYADLLISALRCKKYMTEEEFKSSWDYYMDLYMEAYTSYSLIIEEIVNTYKLMDKSWNIGFYNKKIFIDGFTDENDDLYHFEEYQNQLSRLYPLELGQQDKAIGVNGLMTKSVTLQVTDDCNMACSYCYQHNKKHNSMSFENAKKFIDMLLDAEDNVNKYVTTTKCNGISIEFIGGEPLLEIDLISEISDYFIAEIFRRKHPIGIKFMFSICSNGLLHFDPRVQEYLNKHISHLSYGITIDGNKELHDSCRLDNYGNGTYDRAIAAVADYEAKFNRKMSSKLTISPYNIKYLNDAVRDMIGFGYKHINLNCVYEEGWNNEHAAELYNQLHDLTDWLFDNGLEEKITLSILTENCGKPMDENDNKNWCGGSGSMLAMDYKGDIYPCLRYMESSLGDNQEPMIIGNLDCGIGCISEHLDRINCLDCITRRSQSTDECWNCPIAQGCAWCSAYNYEVHGTANKRATYICCMHKARSLANVYYWRRRGEDFPLHCPKEWALDIISEEEYEKLKAMSYVDHSHMD